MNGTHLYFTCPWAQDLHNSRSRVATMAGSRMERWQNEDILDPSWHDMEGSYIFEKEGGDADKRNNGMTDSERMVRKEQLRKRIAYILLSPICATMLTRSINPSSDSPSSSPSYLSSTERRHHNMAVSEQ